MFCIAEQTKNLKRGCGLAVLALEFEDFVVGDIWPTCLQIAAFVSWDVLEAVPSEGGDEFDPCLFAGRASAVRRGSERAPKVLIKVLNKVRGTSVSGIGA